MKKWSQAGLLLIAGILSACSNGPNSTYEEFGDRINTKGFGHKYAQPEDQDELVLGPGDTIDIQVANNPDLSGAQPIRIEGVVTAPFVGNVKVAGLTSTQIRDKLQILLNPFIRDVSLQIVPISIQSKRIYIYGTDQRGNLSGRIMRLQGDMTLLDLITDIGGINFIADGCHVKVIRGDPRHPKVLTINVVDMIQNGYTAGNIRMRADDIVYLPPTFFAKFAQFFERVTFPLRPITRTLNEVGSAVFFIEEGGLPRRGFVGGGGNF